MSITIFSILVIFGISQIQATDYCAAGLCRSGVTHIACNNDGNFASACINPAMVTITSALQNVLVNAHNKNRNFIAGGGDAKHSPACRMATMTWDNELASIAAYNVRQCEMKHDKCRNTDAFKYSGQNLAWMSYYDPLNVTSKLEAAVQMWYNEVANSKMEYINSYPSNYQGPAIGHFTVMMADKNIKVGCAASTYTVPNAPYKAMLVACNYATTNMVNFPIYASCTTAASKCTTGKNPAYTNLCSTSEVYDVNKWY